MYFKFSFFCILLLKAEFLLLFYLQRLSETNNGVLRPAINWRYRDALEASYRGHVYDDSTIATLILPHNM